MKENSGKRRRRAGKIVLLGALAIIFALIALYAAFTDNKTIDCEYFNIEAQSENQTNAEKIRIAHISDAHFSKLSVDVSALVARLKSENPDIIAITGDLIDKGADLDKCGVYPFVEKLCEIAPVYFASGNHEFESGKSGEFFDELSRRGVKVLCGESETIVIRKRSVTIIGISDNADYGEYACRGNDKAADSYRILLAHRPNPDKWKTYSEGEYLLPDLVLCGHAHGGQMRIFGKGVFAPQQGFFPKFDAGLYKSESGKTTMIVSRGLGNSALPHRVNNPPHLPIITVTM